MAAIGINAGNITAYLDLDTSKFTSGFANAGKELDNFTKKGTTAGQKISSVGSAMTGVGNSLTATVTTPIVGVGAAAVKASMDFEAGMSNVQAISGATGRDMERLRELALEMGAKTKFSSTEAADGFSYMAMAGWKTEDMLAGLPGIMYLAEAANYDLAATSDIVTDALTAFGMTAEESGHFADILASASSNANTNVAMMGETFKYAAPIAGALGYSAEDTAIAIGLMANSGIKASQAGTSLRSIMNRLTGTNDKAATAMGVLGIAFADADGNARPFKDIMDDLRLAFQGTALDNEELVAQMAEYDTQLQNGEITQEEYNSLLAQNLGISAETSAQMNELTNQLNAGRISQEDYDSAMSELLGTTEGLSQQDAILNAYMLAGTEAMSGLLAIVNASEEDYNKLTNAVYNCDGASQQMSETMKDNLAGAVTIFQSALYNAGVEVGDVMNPVLRTLAEMLTNLVSWFSSLDESTIEWIVRIVALVAALGPVLSLLGNVTKVAGGFFGIITKIGGGLAGLMSPAAQATTAIAGAGTGMASAGAAATTAGGFFTKLGGIFKTVATGAKALFAVLAANPIAVIIGLVVALIGYLVHLWNTSEEFKKAVTDAFEAVGEKFKALTDKFKEIFEGDKSIPEMMLGLAKWMFVELPMFFVEAGAEIINGIIKGIFGVDILAKIKEWGGNVIQWFKDVFGIHSPSTVMEEIGTNMNDGLLLSLDKLPDLVSNVFTTVKDGVVGFGEKIFNAGQEAGSKFFGVLEEKFGLSKEEVKGACDKMTGFVTNWGKKTEETGDKTSKGFQKSTKDMSDMSTKQVEQMKTKSLAAINQLETSTDISTRRMAQKTIESATGMKRQAGESISSFCSRAKSEVNSWSNATTNAGSRGSGNFKSSVTKNFSGTASSVKGSLGQTVNEISKFGNRVEREGDQAGAGFRDNFTGEMRQVPNDFSGEMNEIPDYLVKLANVMPGHGKAIMVNLYNAMQSITGRVKSLISGIGSSITNMVSGAIRAFSNLITSANNAGNASRRVNGSHANGLSYVPFDGYIAELHQGERVLTKEENESYNRGGGQSGDVFNFYNTRPEPYEYARQMKKAKRELLENI